MAYLGKMEQKIEMLFLYLIIKYKKRLKKIIL